MSIYSRVWFYACIVAIGGFVFGFDAAVIGGVVGYVGTQFDLDPWAVGMVVTAPTFAAILASFTIGAVSDAIGRKKVLIFLAALYFVSALASAAAGGFWTLVIARMIGGYAFGALTQAPVYIAEISPAKSRGQLTAVNQMTIVVGISFAYFSNLAIQSGVGSLPFYNEEPWRIMLGVEAIPAAIWLMGMFLVPESPRWLATQSRWNEADEILARVTPVDELANSRSCIREDIGESRLPLLTRFSMLFGRKIWFALLIGLIIAIVQQITGINTVFFYATTIFEQSGVGTNAAFVQAVLVGLINIVFTIIAMLLIDRLGRRPLMIIGLTGVAISMSVVAWGFHSAFYMLSADDVAMLETRFPDENFAMLEGLRFESDQSFKRVLGSSYGTDMLRDHEAVFLSAGMEGNPRIILFGILGFIASFAVSLGPVMWVYLAEIFPNHVRGVAISVVTVFNSGASALVQFMFPIQLAYGDIATVFMVYAAFAVIGLVLVVWLMPETRGKPLEEISKEMARLSGHKETKHA